MRAYIYSETPEDQRAPHDSGQSISQVELNEIGVLYWNMKTVEEVDEIANRRDYKNRDQIIVSQEVMGDIYLQKITSFFEEHLHEDEEIRYVLDGSGYFDVRDRSDQRWIRIQVEKGDLLVLPAGIFHRFTVDEKDYIKAMRLFQDEPKWIPLNRSSETECNQYRQAYMQKIMAT